MVVSTGPTTCVPLAPVRAPIDVRHPLPAGQLPVLGLGQMLGSSTSHTLSFHQPPCPCPLNPDSTWVWIGSGITPRPSPVGVRSRKSGWLGHVRVFGLSGHCVRSFAPRLESRTVFANPEPSPPPFPAV